MEANFNSNQYDPDNVEYGGFWIRVLARIIDNSIFAFIILIAILIISLTQDSAYFQIQEWYVPIFLYVIILTSVPWFIFTVPLLIIILFGSVALWPVPVGAIIFYYLLIIIYSLYYILMNYYFGKTLGKMATGLQILRKTEEPLVGVNFGEIVQRFFAMELLSTHIPFLGLGFMFAGWDSNKQCWHDKLADTVVVYENTLILWDKDTGDSDDERTDPRPIPMKGKPFADLVMVSGLMKGKHYTLKGKKVIVGRKMDEVHVHIKDPEKIVSRIQFEIFCSNGRYKIRNRAGRNTTKLNGRVIREDMPLHSEDVISFGSHSAKILFF